MFFPVICYGGAPPIEVDVDSIDVPFHILALEAKKLAKISPEVPVFLLAETLSVLGNRIGFTLIGAEKLLLPPTRPSPHSDMLQLNIRIMHDESNKTLSIRVLRSINVRNLKYLLSVKEKDTVGDTPAFQRLFFAGEQLLNYSHTIDHYNIYNSGSTLDFVLLLCQDKKLIVTVKTISGKTFPLDIYKCRSASKIKDLIQQQQGIPNDQHHKLCFNGEVLDDKRGISYYNISNGSTLLLVDDETLIPRMLHINVELVATGKIIRLQVESSDTINTVKAKIQDQEDIPIAKQMIYLPQRRLLDDSTLADYYIWDNSTLHLAQTQAPPPDYHEEVAVKGRNTAGPAEAYPFTLHCAQNPPAQARPFTFCIPQTLPDYHQGKGVAVKGRNTARPTEVIDANYHQGKEN